MERPRVQRTAVLGVTSLVLLTAAMLATGMLQSSAEQERPEPPAPAEPLTGRAEFTDDVAAQLRNKFDGRGTEVINLRDASRAVVAEFTLEPDQVFPWHTHPGPVIINVAEGDDDAFVYTLADDCVERAYSAGEALIDAGGDNVHTARNDGAADIRVVATILGAPAEGPLTAHVAHDEADELDERCDLVTPRVGEH